MATSFTIDVFRSISQLDRGFRSPFDLAFAPGGKFFDFPLRFIPKQRISALNPSRRV